ncbi:MAG: hypothetical protein MMC33_008913 [Icmadophila ericetorum]|nr:hypothetical protein [Icmadophila ericetorum]
MPAASASLISGPVRILTEGEIVNWDHTSEKRHGVLNGWVIAAAWDGDPTMCRLGKQSIPEISREVYPRDRNQLLRDWNLSIRMSDLSIKIFAPIFNLALLSVLDKEVPAQSAVGTKTGSGYFKKGLRILGEKPRVETKKRKRAEDEEIWPEAGRVVDKKLKLDASDDNASSSGDEIESGQRTDESSENGSDSDGDSDGEEESEEAESPNEAEETDSGEEGDQEVEQEESDAADEDDDMGIEAAMSA